MVLAARVYKLRLAKVNFISCLLMFSFSVSEQVFVPWEKPKHYLRNVKTKPTFVKSLACVVRHENLHNTNINVVNHENS